MFSKEYNYLKLHSIILFVKTSFNNNYHFIITYPLQNINSSLTINFIRIIFNVPHSLHNPFQIFIKIKYSFQISGINLSKSILRKLYLAAHIIFHQKSQVFLNLCTTKGHFNITKQISKLNSQILTRMSNKYLFVIIIRKLIF